MAEPEKKGEFSMDDYFKEGLSDGKEPNNPFEITETDAKKQKSKSSSRSGSKRGMQFKRILIAAAIAVVLLLALVIFIMIKLRQNDGARYAQKLSENIGSQVSVAQKNADITLNPESAYPTLNQLFASYQGIAESRKSCRVQGVKLPEWAIFCNTDVDDLTNVTYYNYELLEKNVFGTERKSYLDPNLVTVGAAADQVEAYLDLEPYRIQYLQGKTALREYRYCYQDAETGDTVAYIITAIWDENGALTSISDSRKNYIATLLASPDPSL
ncbi:MAG TPA: hypothetical protein DCG49_09725 [Ruminococcus sp.]|nr:hypothetical protein [Ruminococcus sp.]